MSSANGSSLSGSRERLLTQGEEEEKDNQEVSEKRPTHVRTVGALCKETGTNS